MKTFTLRDIRSAVILTALLAVIATLALSDRSCQPVGPPAKPSRAITP